MTAPTDEFSRLTIDYRNAMASAVGREHGVTDAMLDEIAPQIAETHIRLLAEHEAGGQRWIDLPSDKALAAEINAFAADARPKYQDFILIGIGGSSLGAIATVQALTDPFRNLLSPESRSGPRFFVLDNPDPEKVAATLATVDLSQHARQRRHQVGTDRRNDGEFPGGQTGIGESRRTGTGQDANRGYDRSD